MVLAQISITPRQIVAVAVVLLSLSLVGDVVAIPASPHPFEVTQPDGSRVTLYIRGDEHFHWLEDEAGFTVVEEDGVYGYGALNAESELVSTGLQVGKVDPRAGGLARRILPPQDVVQRIRQERSRLATQPMEPAMAAAGVTGTRKNVVIMMRFSDHLTRTLPSNADMDVLFNSVGGHPVLAPTGSVRDVYLENSYDQLSMDSTVYGWVDLPNTESYYADGNSGLGFRLRQGIRHALDAADSLIDFSQFDEDNNGFVDAIAFIHSGYGAEWGGFGNQNRIWSHRSSISTWFSDEGVRVSPYHISPGLWGSGGGSAIGHIGVICHETGHFLGLPDLYDTNGGGSGLGSYGMMANSWGFDGSQLYPPHFSAYSKIALGWMTPTVIDIGTHMIEQAETSPMAYRINDGFPAGEYLLIENRQPVGFDGIMPQGGLCIWHIDEGKCCNTDEGYPGQPNWPENNNHYRVAVLQADGDYDLEHGNNRGDGGDVYHGAGVKTIGPDTSPSTDSYQYGTVAETGIIITDISTAGSTMSFEYLGATLAPPARTFETALTSRYLRFLVSPPSYGGVEEVIRVTPVALDGVVGPLPDALYIGPPTDAPEENSSYLGLTFKVAPLQCEPYAHEWSAEGIISIKP